MATVVNPADSQNWADSSEQQFDPDIRPEDVARILGVKPFCNIDPDEFPAGHTLTDILRHHVRIRRYVPGEIIVREGDYGSSAFFLLSGQAHVVPSSTLPTELIGRRPPERKSIWQAISQLWKNPVIPEYRSYSDTKTQMQISGQVQGITGVIIPDAIIQETSADPQTTVLSAGDIFGEIAALGRTPRTATIYATNDVEVAELRWQGLRDIRKRATSFRQHIDKLYRERSLLVQLGESPLFKDLSDDDLREVAEATLFETYGNFDWYTPYKKQQQAGSKQVIDIEPVIAEEGHYVDGLLLIRAGFARLSQRLNHGVHTVSYLRQGDTFGFEEMLHNWRSGEQMHLKYTLRAIGYVDVLRVPSAIIEKLVLPRLENIPQTVMPVNIREQDPLSWMEGEATGGMDTGMVEFLVQNRFINGTATMVINADRCTRCDDCVRACAATHDNNPRFIRHGKNFGNFVVANACMHCTDPVCMIGCPTGAIHRDAYHGDVVINDATCIGCATCVNSCPYHNIRLVNVRDHKGDIMMSPQTGKPVQKATKCDLCVDQPTGPSCERACPHDALIRVDIRDSKRLAEWLSR